MTELRFSELGALQHGWDADGEAPPPNAAAIANAKAMLQALIHEGARVGDIDADVMGGIALYFYADSRVLWIACYNHGAVVAVGSGEDRALAMRAGPQDSACLVVWLTGGQWPSPAFPPSDTSGEVGARCGAGNMDRWNYG